MRRECVRECVYVIDVWSLEMLSKMVVVVVVVVVVV